MIQARLQFSRGDFSLLFDETMPANGVTAIFGASASGKTTLLRCIAGLERAAGRLEVNGEVWQDTRFFLPTHQRRLAYVSQQANLFPHLSVQKNLQYGLSRTPQRERKVSFGQAVEWLGLEKLLTRDEAEQLSGGERQRVAIARALLTSPRMLLMDEPLASLDSAGRSDILPYLERLHKELQIPVLYVSHALDEVTRLADHLVLLEHGRVIANGTLHETLSRLDLSIAGLDDAGAVITATVAQHDEQYHLTRLDFSGGQLWVSRADALLGSSVRVRILARDVSIALLPPSATSIGNILPARIAEISALGAGSVMLRLTLGESQTLLSRITCRSRDSLDLQVGQNVYAQVKTVALMI